MNFGVDGAVVHLADLLVGDSDGVVIVPHEEAEALLPSLRKMVEKEAQLLAQIQNKTVDWFMGRPRAA